LLQETVNTHSNIIGDAVVDEMCVSLSEL
jgi:hypothetical protein